LPAAPTTAAMLLPGLTHALLGHLALRFLLQLRVEFLYQSLEAFASQKFSSGKDPFFDFSRDRIACHIF
jgi:hypothetical protein